MQSARSPSLSVRQWSVHSLVKQSYTCTAAESPFFNIFITLLAAKFKHTENTVIKNTFNFYVKFELFQDIIYLFIIQSYWEITNNSANSCWLHVPGISVPEMCNVS